MDGEDLRNVTHDRAIQILRQTPSVVRMVVFRDGSLLKDEDLYDTLTVEMVKKPGRGLGFSIVGRQHDSGVFIADLVSNSLYLFIHAIIHVIAYSCICLHIHQIAYSYIYIEYEWYPYEWQVEALYCIKYFQIFS